MSTPARWAARMIVSPASNGMSRSSILKVATFSRSCAGKLSSSVALAANHVQRAEARHHVGHHSARYHPLQAPGHVVARRTNPNAPRRAAAVAHEIEAHLAVAAFGKAVNFACGELQTLHHDLEVLDRAFDGRVHVVFR